MIAVRTMMNPAAQSAQAKLRLGLRRTIRAVRVHVRRRVGLVQKPIEFLAVMHTRVRHVILPDQLVLGIRTAIIRYPRRRRTRTAKRAEFEPASSTCSVLNRTRRVAGSYGRSASRGRKPESACRTLPTTSAGW